MKSKMIHCVVLVAVLALSFGAFQGSITTVFAEATPDLELVVKVSEKGFFNEKGKLIGPKNPLEISKGQRVKIIFVFDEAINSLAIGDVHQIAITADDLWTIESEKIWFWNQQTSLTFLAGEEGRMHYRGHCIVDCIGMDHLKNLVINVM